jgi:proline iminopeptidase
MDREAFQIERPGATLRGVQFGVRAGAPVVLLHGGPGMYDYLAESSLAAHLAKSTRVWSFDQRGCRHSASEGPFTVEAQCGDIEAVCALAARDSGREEVAIVGHSAGALYGLHFAARRAQRVLRLVMIGPPGPPGVWQEWRSGWAAEVSARIRATPGLSERLAEIERRSAAARHESERSALRLERLNATVGVYLDARHRTKAPRLEWFDQRVYDAGFADLEAQGREAELRRGLAKFAGRATVIHGASECIPWESAERIVGLFPKGRAEAVKIAECGHFPWVEREGECFRSIDRAMG